jgi:predicted NAD/FAD-dependent oxidoreductase
MIMPRRIPDIAIIGSGMAGLACAERLAERGLQVQVYDKGRQPGGRVAHRARGGLEFEHGAPGFRAQALQLASRVPIASRCRVTGLARTDEGRWRIFVDGHPLRSLYSEVVLALPPAQAAELLTVAPHMARTIAPVRMRPILTAMLGLPRPLGRSFDHIAFHERGLAEARRQPSETVVGPEGWVLHAAADFSRDNLECDPNVVAEYLWQRFRDNLGLVATVPLYLRGHRWRYGRTERPLGRECLHDAALGIGLCGDWCLGDGVEYALASGRALASRMLGIPERPTGTIIAAREGQA